MAKLLRLRRGTDTQHTTFTGAEGEVTVNTTNDSLHVHDGTTAGGREVMRADKDNMPDSGVTAGTYGSSSAIPAITVDAKGLVTSATTSAIDSTAITNGTSNVSVAASGNITATRSGTTRLTVNSTGIDVTGSVTCDGLVNDGDLTCQSGTGTLIIKDTNSTGSAAIQRILGSDSAGSTDWSLGQISSSNSNVYLTNSTSASVVFQTNNSERCLVDPDGHFKPVLNNTYDLGSTGSQWRNGYFDGTVNCDGLISEGNLTMSADDGRMIVRDANNTGVACTARIEGQQSNGATKWRLGNLASGTDTVYLGNNADAPITFFNNNADRCSIDSSGHFVPAANNTYDLGSSGLRWRNVYTNDLNLSNEGGANDVDGTWGSWTIQEGEDDLFLLNRRNGKKYKFNLSEVN
jgi:hypothetical protein